VLIGEDGWLYYQSKTALNDFRGTDLFSKRELAEWKKVLQQRHDWLAKRGIRYVFVIVPEKHAIYSEAMPDSITRVTNESRIGQLEAALNRDNSIAFVNLTQSLHEAKAEQRVFHKTDAHWNAYGAFAGSKELLTYLKAWYPQIRVPELSDYKIAVHDCDMMSVQEASPWLKMDLAVMLNSPLPQREEVIDLVPLRERDRVPVQFYGIPRSEADLVRHHTWEQGELPTVFIIHDSCMMAMAPFLAPHFQEVTYHWTHEFPAEEIEKARPVLVIQQMVQRKLMNHDPKNPPIVADEF
jgi:hypothetical protein